MTRREVGSKRELRPGVWQIRASCGRTTEGKQRTVSRTVHGTSQDAELALNKLVHEITHKPGLGERMTLSDYFWDFFLPDRQKTVTKATWKTYETTFRRHIEPALGHKQISEIDNFTVKDWISTLEPQSAPNYVRSLRAILNQAHFDHVISDSPMDGYRYKMPRGRDTTPRPVWGAREVLEALSRPSFRKSRIFPLWCVMCGGGLSRSEALALSWEDIEWTDALGMDGKTHWTAYVSIKEAVTQMDGRKDPKNSRRYRSVPIPSLFADHLHERIGTGPLLQSVKHGVDHDWPTGKCISPDRVPELWRKMFDAGQPLHGMPYVWLNRMRATYATLMQGAGIDSTVINAMQGRSGNSQVLYANYLNPGGDTFNAAASILEKKLAGNE